MERHTLRMTSRSARPIVALARQPGPKQPGGAVHVEAGARGTVDDHDLRRARQRAGGAVAVALLVQVRAHGCDHDRHVLAPAAGHHRVDRHVLGGDDDFARRHRADDDVGLELGSGEEVGHELGGGRHHREAVGPAALVVVVEQLRVVRVLVTRCMQRAHGFILAPPEGGRTPAPRPVDAD